MFLLVPAYPGCPAQTAVKWLLLLLLLSIFARNPRLLDVAAQLKRSAHAALGLAVNCAQQYQLQTNGHTGLFFGRLK